MVFNRFVHPSGQRLDTKGPLGIVACISYPLLCVLAVVVLVEGFERIPTDSLFSAKDFDLLSRNLHEAKVGPEILASLAQGVTIGLSDSAIPEREELRCHQMEAFCGAHGPENLLKVTENLSDCHLLLVFQAFDRAQSKSCKPLMMSVEQMFDIREMLAVKFLVSVECFVPCLKEHG